MGYTLVTMWVMMHVHVLDCIRKLCTYNPYSITIPYSLANLYYVNYNSFLPYSINNPSLKTE